MRLTDAAVSRLRPGEREYTVWDTTVRGLGVRVRTTGGKSWVHLRRSESGSRRVSFGPVETASVAEARRACLARQAAPEPEGRAARKDAVPLLRDFVAGDWRKANYDRYKPSTRKGVRSLLNTRVLPAFGSKRLDRIAPTAVRRWFDDFSRTAPGNANHGLALLQQILNFAAACGHIDTNPARNIQRNRRPVLTRFLSREEVDRLHRVLERQTGRGQRQQADIVRLLLLTAVPQGRDPAAPLVGSPRRTPDPPGEQDRAEDGSPQHAGPRSARASAARDKPLRLSLAARPVAAAQSRSRSLVPGTARGRHRGRAPSRPASYSCEPRGDERRAGAGGRPPAWPFRCSHDAALRPSRGPGNRASGREGRKGDSGHHGTEPSTAPLGYIERQLVRVTHPFHPLHGREFPLVEIKSVELVHYTGDDGALRSIRRGLLQIGAWGCPKMDGV